MYIQQRYETRLKCLLMWIERICCTHLANIEMEAQKGFEARGSGVKTGDGQTAVRAVPVSILRTVDIVGTATVLGVWYG